MLCEVEGMTAVRAVRVDHDVHMCESWMWRCYLSFGWTRTYPISCWREFAGSVIPVCELYWQKSIQTVGDVSGRLHEVCSCVFIRRFTRSLVFDNDFVFSATVLNFMLTLSPNLVLTFVLCIWALFFTRSPATSPQCLFLVSAITTTIPKTSQNRNTRSTWANWTWSHQNGHKDWAKRSLCSAWESIGAKLYGPLDASV